MDVVRLHTRMLNDRGRTQRFLDAIAEVVRPGDVVLDIGTGTGILAMAAARAGARRVFAIEGGPVAAAARQLIAANGYADRIEVLSGHSTELELPERADVLITETLGNAPLTEQILETVLDARKRLLKPKARIIPETVRVFAHPLDVPAGERARRVFTPTGLERWREWYGMDFTDLGAVNPQGLLMHLFAPGRVQACRRLAPPLELAQIRLRSLRTASVNTTSEVRMRRDGLLSGLAIHFELRLSPGVTLSTDPRSVEPDNHWLNPVYIFVEPLEVRRGDPVCITYSYNPTDREEWLDVRVEEAHDEADPDPSDDS